MNMPWSEIMPSTDAPGSTTISKHGAMMQICPFWLGSYPLHMGSSNSLLILRKLLVSYPNMDVFSLIFNGCFSIPTGYPILWMFFRWYCHDCWILGSQWLSNALKKKNSILAGHISIFDAWIPSFSWVKSCCLPLKNNQTWSHSWKIPSGKLT